MNKKMMMLGTTMLILKLLERKDMYGYQIISEIEKSSDNVFLLKEGTLYPILHRLEAQNAVESYEKVAKSGRIRKYYHLAENGRKILKQKEKEWYAYEKAIRNIMEGGVAFAC